MSKMTNQVMNEKFIGEISMIFGASLLGALFSIVIKDSLILIRIFLFIAIFLILIGYYKKNKK